MISKIILCICLVYFIVIAFTVERGYCARPLTADDPRFLMAVTYEFSAANNRLFLERPEWLRQAICLSAYIFPFYYVAVLATAIMDAWHVKPLQYFLLIFVGFKIYAFGFYHFFQFTSHVPPENLLPYWAAEGPYIVAIGLVLKNVWDAMTGTADNKPKSN
ncbi:expressed unknown protein [Seminavis robusta]|uniref:Uncharacterized protein n=1 Tax=Seminavis robusta TaxID=568900 RepID=A0A9N8HB44_9STRA|nr:expressed unknown protein [Seminavis robusta]|eukprot:Sro347_g122900.1 n/a (161) ;mRNA; f:26928-27410